MKTIVGEIAASQSTNDRRTTPTQQIELAAGDDDIASVETHDLPLKQDGIHFGRAEKLSIGRRFASAMLHRETINVGVEDVANSVDATRLVFDQYVPHPNGETNTLPNDAATSAVFADTFTGFVEGLNNQESVRLGVDGTSGSVAFADYDSSHASSDIAGGGSDEGLANSGSSIDFCLKAMNSYQNRAVNCRFSPDWPAFSLYDMLDEALIEEHTTAQCASFFAQHGEYSTRNGVSLAN